MAAQSEQGGKSYNVNVDGELARMLELESQHTGRSVEDCISNMLRTARLNESAFSALSRDYFRNRTTADFELEGKILDLESKYFEDMTFQPDSGVAEFLKFNTMVGGEWEDMYESVPEVLSSLNLSHYRFYVKDEFQDEYGRNIIGRANSLYRVIELARAYVNDEKVLLHEMIHAYETVLDDCAPFFHDILLYCMYKDLSARKKENGDLAIPDLDERIKNHAHIGAQKDITKVGGSHNILFLLKSFDLDLRCGYPLGTIHAYGRADFGKRSEEEQLLDVAMEMLECGDSVKEVVEKTGLALEQVEALAKELEEN